MLLGSIDTPATASHAKKLGIPKEELVAQAVKSHFIKRMGSTDDVAKCVLFLASDESTFVTGTTIPVDGGVLAQ
jgi:NAD(P)-dependent dehydrogenase (short-subunit alcohol dehydrogenase family)